MIPCELSRRLGRITRESECLRTPIDCPIDAVLLCIPERLKQCKTKGATNEKCDEGYESNTRNLSVLLHRFLAVYVQCTVSAEQRGTRPEYCSGAWSLGRGAGWKGVYNILVKDGYNVSIVQEPETSFQDDVAAVKRVLALQDGPSILVAHSYGGAVITEAGSDPSVAGLVYVAAHMPDAGEKESEDGKRFPSALAKSGAIKKTPDGFTYIDPAQFHELFAADLSSEQAAIMARSQVFNFVDNFSATITTVAWRTKPSWMLVAEVIERSTRTWSVGMPSGLEATPSKLQVPATQSMFRTRRRYRT